MTDLCLTGFVSLLSKICGKDETAIDVSSKDILVITSSIIEGSDNFKSFEDNKKKLGTLFKQYGRLFDKKGTPAFMKIFVGKLRRIDHELESVVYLGASNTSLSTLDVLLFSVLLECDFRSLSREDYNAVPSVTRYYTYLQNEEKIAPHAEPLMKINENAIKKKPPAKKNNDNNSKPKKQKKKVVVDVDKAVGELELRVGEIISVKSHPDRDRLYVEEISFGEETRTICSGLKEFLTEDDLLGAKVLVICNLKPRKMGTIMSAGMVLCVSSEDHKQVELVTIEDDKVEVGSRIEMEGYKNNDKFPAKLNPKKKQWEECSGFFTVKKSGDKNLAYFKDTLLVAGGSNFVSKTLLGHIG